MKNSGENPELRPFSWTRAFLVGLLGTLCILVIATAPQFASWRDQWQSRLQRPLVSFSPPWNLQTNSPTSFPILSASAVTATIQKARQDKNLPLLGENETLARLARLVAIAAEDEQSISVPPETESMLKSLTPLPPKNAESLILFAPEGRPLPDLAPEVSSASSIFLKSSTQLGVATRSATFNGIHGILAVAIISGTFPSRVPTPQPVAQKRITFTGQDLWTAVQNYRQGHALPAFEMSPELCTVASIRVNQLLELGKLDNHDGFKAQSDAFFERNPGWTDINENIASGYATAVQTVEWGWDQSLGHQALIQSRTFPKACAAANSGFAVLITGK